MKFSIKNHISTVMLNNVPESDPSPANRVRAMWQITGEVTNELDNDDLLNKRKFLLHVSWHEGAFLTARRQIGGGPGRSFFQFEPPLAKDAVLYAKQKGWLYLLASASDYTEAQLIIAANGLSGGSWPSGNFIERSLLNSDLFGTYLARVALKKLPSAIPSGNALHAVYWADNWKKVFDSPAQRRELISRFEREANECDRYIPSLNNRRPRNTLPVRNTDSGSSWV